MPAIEPLSEEAFEFQVRKFLEAKNGACLHSGLSETGLHCMYTNIQSVLSEQHVF